MFSLECAKKEYYSYHNDFINSCQWDSIVVEPNDHIIFSHVIKEYHWYQNDFINTCLLGSIVVEPNSKVIYSVLKTFGKGMSFIS